MGTSKGSVLYLHNDSNSSHLVRLPNQKSVRSTVIGKEREGVIATVDGIMRCFTYVWAPESEADPSLHAELEWTAQFNLGDSPVALLPIADYTKLLAITRGGRMFCFDFKSIKGGYCGATHPDSTSADVLEYLWDVTLPGIVHSASVCEDGGLLVVALTARDPQDYVRAYMLSDAGCDTSDNGHYD
ncbi:MAG: uncharacterized protein KVP18_001145 [Porospora cf. gigantea A]|uniref:uncharacterized protein n=1 Tax=Porospora cf. gigantea A TaxID=2853593 RepID=UPI003559E5B1|nr:MAG: hypothetical protein KVP18_001145 [Porospora cf. gigantea A]